MKPLNGHQFSQGNFGSLEPTMNVKPTDEHRYPRGYTPERYHEVADALPAEQFSVRSGHNVSTSGYGDPGNASGTAYDRSAGLPGDEVARRMGRAERGPFRARVIDTVARSQVPAEHLGDHVMPHVGTSIDGKPLEEWQHNIPDTVVHSPQFVLSPTSLHQSGSHTVGVPTQYSDLHKEYFPTIELNPGQRSDDRHEDRTLIHELGHQMSNAETTPHSMIRNRHLPNYGQTPAKMGEEEGYADRYASEHLVRRRGEDPDVEKDHPYPARQYGFAGRDKATFDNNYGNTHWMKPLADGQTPYDKSVEARTPATALASRAGSRAASDAGSQAHLFSRAAEAVVTQNVPDHGQFPIYSEHSEDRMNLPTIPVGGGVPQHVQEKTEAVESAWSRARNDLGRSPAYYPGGPEQHEDDRTLLATGVQDRWGEEQVARGEKYLQKLKDKGYTDFAKRGQITPHNEFVEKARAAHPWPQR